MLTTIPPAEPQWRKTPLLDKLTSGNAAMTRKCIAPAGSTSPTNGHSLSGAPESPSPADIQDRDLASMVRKAAGDSTSLASHAETAEARMFHCIRRNSVALLEKRGDVRMNVRRKEIYVGDDYLGTDNAVPIIQRNVGRVEENLKINKAGVLYAPSWPTMTVRQQLISLANVNAYDPVLDYLNGLPAWDGIDRVPGLVDALHLAKPQDVFVDFVRKTLISAVARVYWPGCKVDTMLILHADKGGEMKSSFFRALFGDEFFSDDCIDVTSKDSWMQINRFWCIEWTEMEALKSARSRESIKAFLSRQTDTYRAPYGHDLETHPRAGIFVGTTNPSVILENDGGNRRFWIIPNVGSVDLAVVRATRNLIWAQAVAAFRAGAKWWLTPDEEKRREDLQQDHVHEELGAEAVASWIAAKEEVTVEEILTKGPTLFQSTTFQSRRGQMSVARILKSLGWEKTEQMRAGVRAKRWRRGPQADKQSTRTVFGKDAKVIDIRAEVQKGSVS
jgi:predicted P-loop ATPase